MPWVTEVRQVDSAFQESVQSNSKDETRRSITALQTRNSASVRDVPGFLWYSTRWGMGLGIGKKIREGCGRMYWFLKNGKTVMDSHWTWGNSKRHRGWRLCLENILSMYMFICVCVYVRKRYWHARMYARQGEVDEARKIGYSWLCICIQPDANSIMVTWEYVKNPESGTTPHSLNESVCILTRSPCDSHAR